MAGRGGARRGVESVRAVTYRYLHVLHRFTDKGAQQPYGAKAEPLPPPPPLSLPSPFGSPPFAARCSFRLSISLSASLSSRFSRTPFGTPIRHARFNSLMNLYSLITSANVVPTFHMLRGMCMRRDVHNQGLHISPLRSTRV